MSKKLFTAFIYISLASVALATEVTPQMTSKLEVGGAQINGATANASQKYNAKVQQVTETIGAHGGTVTVIQTRDMSLSGAGPSYYVTGRDGQTVKVSSYRSGDKSGHATTVEKTVTVYSPGAGTATSLYIEIPHADAKTAAILKRGEIQDESTAETIAKAGSAMNVAIDRGNVTKNVSTVPGF